MFRERLLAVRVGQPFVSLRGLPLQTGRELFRRLIVGVAPDLPPVPVGKGVVDVIAAILAANLRPVLRQRGRLSAAPLVFPTGQTFTLAGDDLCPGRDGTGVGRTID